MKNLNLSKCLFYFVDNQLEKHWLKDAIVDPCLRPQREKGISTGTEGQRVRLNTVLSATLRTSFHVAGRTRQNPTFFDVRNFGHNGEGGRGGVAPHSIVIRTI